MSKGLKPGKVRVKIEVGQEGTKNLIGLEQTVDLADDAGSAIYVPATVPTLMNAILRLIEQETEHVRSKSRL